MRWVGKMPKPEDVVEKDEDCWCSARSAMSQHGKMCNDNSIKKGGERQTA